MNKHLNSYGWEILVDFTPREVQIASQRENIMRKLLTAAIFAISAAQASAMCVGSGALTSCTDTQGNSYTVNRFGNTTITNGHNAGTGSSWSQTDMSVGNSVYTNGNTNGNSWNMQRHHHGSGLSTYSGTDSRGDSFMGTCTQFGCN
ncbi:hypothetical protein [Pseudorhizobium marinum]|uniref:hypothetical protein n=1 Tax=Pseudorhizobium marinum TaxID=1496690 RepID=UPI001AEC0160|nr:hypothetical protein [Pseudorhizobium marinum]